MTWRITSRRAYTDPQVERLLVCGGRDFADRDALFAALDHFNAKHGPVELVVHGAAPGADTLAGRWATCRGLGVAECPADWNRHGKLAGPIRNQSMLDEWMPDAVYAFPGGRGTDDMIARAHRAKVVVYRYVREALKCE